MKQADLLLHRCVYKGLKSSDLACWIKWVETFCDLVNAGRGVLV